MRINKNKTSLCITFLLFSVKKLLDKVRIAYNREKIESNFFDSVGNNIDAQRRKEFKSISFQFFTKFT
jgi:hypothetical protein